MDGLKQFYNTDYLAKLAQNSEGEPVITTYLPQSDAALTRQIQFISENPAETGSKEDLMRPKSVGTQDADFGPYANAHVQYHPLFVRMLNRLGYYDIFLIDHKSGDIVYSVYKEADFATNLDDGPYRFTGLAKAFDAVRKVSIAKTTYDDLQDQTPFKSAKSIKSDALGTIERWVSSIPTLVDKTERGA